MATIIARIQSETSENATGSPRARMAGLYLDRISTLAARVQPHGRFSAFACGKSTAMAFRRVAAMVGEIKSAGLSA